MILQLLDAMQNKEYCTFMFLFLKVVTLQRATRSASYNEILSEQNYILPWFFVFH